MCLPAFDETFTSIPTDVEEIIALQEYIEALEWQQWCDIAHEEAMNWLEEHGF